MSDNTSAEKTATETETETETETPPEPDFPDLESVNEDADAWQDLSEEEQDAVLDEGLARLDGEKGEGHWRHLSDKAQRQTLAAIEQRRRSEDTDPDDLSETEKAMQAALRQTWTAELFDDDDGRPTIPFEVRELEQLEQDIVQDGFRMLISIQRAAEEAEEKGEDDINIDDIEHDSDFFDSVEAFENWLMAFLADVTMDDAYDEARWESGAGLVAGTRSELMGTIFLRYQDEEEQSRQFRNERGR